MITLPGQREAPRVSPHHINPDGHDFFALIDTYLDSEDQARVRDAFELARLEHENQRRRSGELFFTHPLIVSYYLAEYRLDAAALMAALLHDIAEDTLVSIQQIRDLFGDEVSYLVDGVTNLKEVSAGIARDRLLTPDEIQDASLHKMFDAMTADVRVVLVKLFDRLHNMRTIQALPISTQLRKANETLLVYAPLANRLGIWHLKGELEGLCLQVLDADAYSAVHQALERASRRHQSAYISVTKQITQHLGENDLVVANVLPSPESEYSVYLALTAVGAPYSGLEHPLRVVVLLDDVPSCYLALGYLHQKWRPVPGTFDDYIASPRENLYRALHTTVIHSTGRSLKIRFRSVEMNEISEIGVLARWLYAGTPMWTRAMAERVQALFTDVRENIHREPQDYRTGIQSVVEDVFRQQVMVSTPRGDIIELPKGATPVDFAYAIHTEVGNRCQTAYINETRYPLNKPLEDGDRVRIVKSGWARPQRTWLDEDLGYLATSKARSQVRRWFRRLSEELAISEGRNLLAFELKMLGLQDYSHQEVADQFDFARPRDLYHRMGRAELLPTTVSTRVLQLDWHQEPTRNIGKVVSSGSGQDYIITNAGSRELRLCRSCNARPGDSIVGFLRTDGEVTVHKEDCYTLRPDPLADRTIKLAWGSADSHEVRLVTIQIDVYDRSGLLFEIAELLQDEKVNISSIHTSELGKEGAVRVVLEVEIVSPRQLVRILHRAHALVNVFSVRLLHPKNQPETQSI
jgi:RelA/SpoT family (p)ppGpp synthetase